MRVIGWPCIFDYLSDVLNLQELSGIISSPHTEAGKIETFCHSPLIWFLKGLHKETSRLLVKAATTQLDSLNIYLIRLQCPYQYVLDALVGERAIPIQDTSREPSDSVPQSQDTLRLN